MKTYPVRLEVREDAEGWRLFALPCHNVGWAPVPMTPPRGTPGGALVEFASALYRLTAGEQLAQQRSGDNLQPRVREADGFQRMLRFYDRGPNDPPGNGYAMACPDCGRLRAEGHAVECPWVTHPPA